jgi:MFS superfamily sulfate permease-like transporter
MKKHPYYDRKSKEDSFKIAVWSGIGLVIMFLFLLLTSCTPEEEVLSYEYSRPNHKAFITTDGTQSYNQTIYLDTIEDYVYTKIYAESTEMEEHKKYNGEYNILASFSTTSYWNYSNGNLVDYPVYYVYPFSVRFVPPSNRYEYQPTTLALYTQQMVGPIPKSAIINREKVKIYMDVSYDGDYHIKDSILVKLQPK